MIKIAIVDDEPDYIKHIEKITCDYFNATELQYQITTYNMPQELLWDIEEDEYFDIYLIDIEMPVVNGMKLAYAIRQKYDTPFIIFVTAYLKYCIKGYEYNVWRYITKDTMSETLPLAFDGLLEKMNNKIQKFYIIELRYRISKISYDDIYYFRKDGKYTEFYTKQGVFRERKSILKVLEDLNDVVFVLTDRSYAVNLRHVMMLGDHCLTLRNNAEVPISIPQFTKVKKIISDYWRSQD